MRRFRTPHFFRWIFPGRMWGFLRADRAIYLTFDDGPDPLITPFVLDVLKKEKVAATFFCVGENVKKNPELFQRVIREGHLVCNHSQQHKNGIKTSKKAYVEDIKMADAYFENTFFRPPYGRLTLPQYYALRKTHKVVMWTWLSYDYDKKVSVQKIIDKADKIKSGDILVLHDNGKIADKQKELLPQLLRKLKEKKFDFRLISDACITEQSNKVHRT